MLIQKWPDVTQDPYTYGLNDHIFGMPTKFGNLLRHTLYEN